MPSKIGKSSDEILKRKRDHLSLVCGAFDALHARSGFCNYRFEHNALPEVSFVDIDTSVHFLARRLSFPLVISPITGGSKRGKIINRQLAEIADSFGLGVSVGSQRISIESGFFEDSFKVRKYAPNVLLLANLGAIQLNYGYSVDQCKQAVEMIEADALVLHLNPIQEVFQKEGNTNFSGLLRKIEKICSSLNYPVIIKEIGYGISASVAKKLQEIGVYGIDVAGAGAISWASLESSRSDDIIMQNASKAFDDWGNTTADCLKSISDCLIKVKLIASGGIKTGVDMAKAIALGADICGNASDFLRRIAISQAECEVFVKSIIAELKTAMFCVGCKDINELKSVKLLSSGGS